MVKCECCGNEALFPFSCPYCHKAFCPEHRLPESHQCSSLPKDPLFWYQKKTLADEKALKDAMHGYEFCPKCHSYNIGVWSFDNQKVNYQCRICRYSWTAPRTKVSSLDIKIPKGSEGTEKKKKRRWFS